MMPFVGRKSLFILAILFVPLLTGCPPAQPRPDSPILVAPTAKGTRYTIKKGDTRYSIGRKHGVDWRLIVRANPFLRDLYNLKPGQVIVIPGDNAVKPPPVPKKHVADTPGHRGPIPAEKTFAWPLKGTVLSHFGRQVPWRYNDSNNGLDIRATPGQIVRAAKSGKVYTFQTVPGFGKVVELSHQDGALTFYGHLDRILVEHGTWVKQGERIGMAGSSGLSSGTELHFRILRNEKWVDPLPLLPK